MKPVSRRRINHEGARVIAAGGHGIADNLCKIKSVDDCASFVYFKNRGLSVSIAIHLNQGSCFTSLVIVVPDSQNVI